MTMSTPSLCTTTYSRDGSPPPRPRRIPAHPGVTKHLRRSGPDLEAGGRERTKIYHLCIYHIPPPGPGYALARHTRPLDLKEARKGKSHRRHPKEQIRRVFSPPKEGPLRTFRPSFPSSYLALSYAFPRLNLTYTTKSSSTSSSASEHRRYRFTWIFIFERPAGHQSQAAIRQCWVHANDQDRRQQSPDPSQHVHHRMWDEAGRGTKPDPARGKGGDMAGQGGWTGMLRKLSGLRGCPTISRGRRSVS